MLEWHFVVETEAIPEKLGFERWPQESPEKLPDRSRCRARKPLAHLVQAADEFNEQLKSDNQPILIEVEVITANLYTGPVRKPSAQNTIDITIQRCLVHADVCEVQWRVARLEVSLTFPEELDDTALLPV